MWISQVELYNIRPFRQAAIPLSQGLNVFVGPNNSGKSTILCPVERRRQGLLKKFLSCPVGATFISPTGLSRWAKTRRCPG